VAEACAVSSPNRKEKAMKRLLLPLAVVVVGLCALALPPAPARKASARTVTIDTTKWYHIINRRSGKCLDMANANFTPGARPFVVSLSTASLFPAFGSSRLDFGGAQRI
jgi:hypothetical protein